MIFTKYVEIYIDEFQEIIKICKKRKMHYEHDNWNEMVRKETIRIPPTIENIKILFEEKILKFEEFVNLNKENSLNDGIEYLYFLENNHSLIDE